MRVEKPKIKSSEEFDCNTDLKALSKDSFFGLSFEWVRESASNSSIAVSLKGESSECYGRGSNCLYPLGM